MFHHRLRIFSSKYRGSISATSFNEHVTVYAVSAIPRGITTACYFVKLISDNPDSISLSERRADKLMVISINFELRTYHNQSSV